MDAERERQMNLVLVNAGIEWKSQAFTFLCEYARTHAVFSGEDVSDAHAAAGHPQPHDLRAWGALYGAAKRQGVIAPLDNNGWSKRRSSPCTRYRSLTCMQVAA